MRLPGKLGRLRRPADVWLLARMLMALLGLPRLLRRPIRAVVAQLAVPPETPVRYEAAQVAVTARFLVRVFPFSRRQPCLYRSLLLYRYLPEAGVRPRIFFGAKRSDQPPAESEAIGLAGHSWVEANGVVVLDSVENVRQYTVAFSAPEGQP
jgi:hypothetical protein